MPSLSVGVDEFTLILQSTDKVMVTDWADVVNEIVDIFLVKSLLMNLFGDDIWKPISCNSFRQTPC